MQGICEIQILGTKGTTTLRVQSGAVLRNVLLENACSPYSSKHRQLNCKGLGICGTCQVLVKEGEGYWPRRSCQIKCYKNLEIKIKPRKMNDT